MEDETRSGGSVERLYSEDEIGSMEDEARSGGSVERLYSEDEIGSMEDEARSGGSVERLYSEDEIGSHAEAIGATPYNDDRTAIGATPYHHNRTPWTAHETRLYVEGIERFPPSNSLHERAMFLEIQHYGQDVCTPGSKKLGEMLEEVYIQIQPNQEDRDTRQALIRFITKVVRRKIGGSNFRPFGSFVMDLFTTSSDLDLSLTLPDGNHDDSHAYQVHHLKKIANALYGLQNGRQSVREIEKIFRAIVPVVTFIDCKSEIRCDIVVESNDGVLKSRVLRMVSTMDCRFRQLCYLAKAWAKKQNVNTAKHGTLNSLSICLLMAFHLQTCSPPILPPFSVFMEGLHLPDLERCLETLAFRVREYKERDIGENNTQSVPQLFCSFFHKLIAVKNLWIDGLCPSTFEGKWIRKTWQKQNAGCISVEDFVERHKNAARSLTPGGHSLIYEALQSTLSNLKVIQAEDLKSYLFGVIKQRRGDLDHVHYSKQTAFLQNRGSVKKDSCTKFAQPFQSDRRHGYVYRDEDFPTLSATSNSAKVQIGR